MVSTKDIMRLSLKLAGLRSTPEDSAIYVSGANIEKVLFGIDAGVPELLLAKELDLDAVIAHHPQGARAIVDFHEVFKRHIQQMVAAGIPNKTAKKAAQNKLKTLEVEMHMRNYGHADEVAKLLKMPYMNIHTPLDEIGRRRMTNQIRQRVGKDSVVQDVVSALEELTEFKNATTKIKIRLGESTNPAGKVVVSHGAGTNGGYEIAKTYFEHGIGTLVYIHISPKELKKLKMDNAENLIVTGHIASDSVGINPLIHELERRDISLTTIGIVPS